MKHKVDISNWKRREHFHFFKQFEEPYHGVTVTIDCTRAYQYSKANGTSFFLYYLYQCLVASNQLEAFKLRILDDELYRFDRIDAGSALARDNGTFGFGDFIYYPTFEEFNTEAGKVMKRVATETDLQRSSAENVIRFSALPWIDFTALSHARLFAFKDSCPKISFGKVADTNGKKTMPLSIHVHHALIDGRDLGEFLALYQDLVNR
ncbi:chloramphenicol acetyltransferase [Mucilaginibacter ginkgonis]|uniref:Chloramphenicol acetyltransferase n=1 Tax=Mucilaginibacter ginkgonis TaxID=2682091 RepID=A0A6I4I2C4_9SPHI|nr:chloramphenicol acetyltransferase [Mucilaginibacter ginkgonis]QQL50826.1 chloramphenicol acetyltransferase [Mucilaginibacter ginkgonis]